MSTFHVKEILKKRPELIGILGKRRIKQLQHAWVEIIDQRFLDCSSCGGTFFIVSHDGTFLGEVGRINTRRTPFEWMLHFFRFESIFNAIQRIGAERIAYIARYDKPDCDGVYPCAVVILKPAGNLRLDEHLRQLSFGVSRGLNIPTSGEAVGVTTSKLIPIPLYDVEMGVYVKHADTDLMSSHECDECGRAMTVHGDTLSCNFCDIHIDSDCRKLDAHIKSFSKEFWEEFWKIDDPEKRSAFEREFKELKEKYST